MEYKILRLSAVKAEGKFPQQISLGSRAVGWINSEVINWIEHRISESRVNETKTG